MTFQPLTPTNAGILSEKEEKKGEESARSELSDLRCQQEHCVDKELFVRAMRNRGVIEDETDEILIRGIANQKEGENFIELFSEI